MKKHYLFLCLFYCLTYTSLGQETFSVEFGQFFEQGYGSNLDEEGIDIGPFNDDKLLVGWQDVSEGETGTKDAAVWHIEERGKEQYLKLLGITEFDEVATGVIQVDPETYAICVHQSSNWDHMDVKAGDETWVYLIQSGGAVLWSYNITPGEEGGIAPSDIIVDANEDIVILLNRLDASGTVSNEIVSLNKLGQQNWTSSSYSQSLLGGWAFELLENSGEYITLVNDNSLNFPFALKFAFGGTVTNVSNYPNAFSNHLFGLDYDNISQSLLGAGYTVIEGDTNSYVARLSLGLNLVTDWNYGTTGTEKFIDIVSTGDGFVAGGVRNNKGEGKYDCYIHHLDGNLATFAEETMGGLTSERLNNLNLMASATDVWFAGHNIEWTLNESGNAYLGATTLGFSSTGSSCEIPRVIFVDAILKPNPNFPSANYTNGYSLGNATANLTLLQEIDRLNGNIIVLYDIDQLLIELEQQSLSQNSALVQYVEDFIDQATSPPFNFTVGMVMGPGLKKLALTSAWLSAANSVSYWNYNKPTKFNFMVLEHEFWTMQNPFSGFSLLDQAAWISKPLVLNTSIGVSLSPNVNYGATAPNINLKNIYYNQAIADHHFLLTSLRASADNSANNWKVFDYIYSFWNREMGAWGGPVKHYSALDLNNASLNLVNYEITSDAHRDQFADVSKSLSDAVFLVYYRQAHQVNDYDIALETLPWAGRMTALLTSSPQAPANIIPLFSAEQISCQIGYDQNGNGKSGNAKIGTWLGQNNGNNNLSRN